MQLDKPATAEFSCCFAKKQTNFMLIQEPYVFKVLGWPSAQPFADRLSNRKPMACILVVAQIVIQCILLPQASDLDNTVAKLTVNDSERKVTV